VKPKYQHVEVPVPGNVMVLKYKDILNLDVTFKRVKVNIVDAQATSHVHTEGTQGRP